MFVTPPRCMKVGVVVRPVRKPSEGFVDLLDVCAVEIKFHGGGLTAKGAKNAKECGGLGVNGLMTVLHFHGVEVSRVSGIPQVGDAELAGCIAKSVLGSGAFQ